LFSWLLLAAACGEGSPPGADPSLDYHGIWVSEDGPGMLHVIELLPYEPYLPLLSGRRQVYRVWKVPAAEAPYWIEYGVFAVVDGALHLTPTRSKVGDQINFTYVHRLYDVDLTAGRMDLEAPGFPDDRRTFGRVDTFPGGAWEGLPPHGDLTEPSRRRPLVEDAPLLEEVWQGALFRSGENEALAVRAVMFFADSPLTRFTQLDLHRTVDGGDVWSLDPFGGGAGYDVSGARLKEQAHGRPLVFPDDTLSEYLYLWSPELETWEQDNDIQICRVSAGFPDQDVVLTAWHGLAYTLCIADPEVVYVHRRRPDLNSFRIQYLQGPVAGIRAQWDAGEGPRGTLYGLVFTGTQEPALRLYRHQEDDSADFGPEQLAAPVAELAGSCGDLPCEFTGLWRYHLAGGEHHIVALARFDGPAPAHPLAPEDRLAVYLHGTPGGGFTTEVLNVGGPAGARVFLGNLVDVELPVDGVAGTAAPAALLQDRACLRVRRAAAGGAWEDVGVVPTAHRPAEGAVVLWSDRVGMLSADLAMDYLEFPLSSDPARCPAPRALP
ncbi:hypothetical protein KKC22_13210, partial [Myxococcota bacterium]|nr:hypothetical protein [Myxococcota bacterium]